MGLFPFNHKKCLLQYLELFGLPPETLPPSVLATVSEFLKEDAKYYGQHRLSAGMKIEEVFVRELAVLLVHQLAPQAFSALDRSWRSSVAFSLQQLADDPNRAASRAIKLLLDQGILSKVRLE